MFSIFHLFFSIFLFVHLELRDQRDGLREPFDVPFYVLLCLFVLVLVFGGVSTATVRFFIYLI